MRTDDRGADLTRAAMRLKAMKSASSAGSPGTRLGGAGALPKITWALVPPKPKELRPGSPSDQPPKDAQKYTREKKQKQSTTRSVFAVSFRS